MGNINSKFKIQNSKLVKWLALKSEAMKGFTLVELLVVIGVLGILAAGLLATIDPLEQFRKGADSNRKTTALELVNAITRYYATKNVMPWAATGDAACRTAVGGSDTASEIAVSPTFDACIDALVAQGELKDTFKAQKAITEKLFLNGTATTTNVCYDPESKAESLRTETKYNKNGIDFVGTCTATSLCYWCAR